MPMRKQVPKGDRLWATGPFGQLRTSRNQPDQLPPRPEAPPPSEPLARGCCAAWTPSGPEWVGGDERRRSGGVWVGPCAKKGVARLFLFFWGGDARSCFFLGGGTPKWWIFLLVSLSHHKNGVPSLKKTTHPYMGVSFFEARDPFFGSVQSKVQGQPPAWGFPFQDTPMYLYCLDTKLGN